MQCNAMQCDVCMYVCMCGCVTLRTFCLANSLPVCLSVCLFACLSVCVSVCLSACLFVCLLGFFCLPFALAVCLPVCLPLPGPCGAQAIGNRAWAVCPRLLLPYEAILRSHTCPRLLRPWEANRRSDTAVRNPRKRRKPQTVADRRLSTQDPLPRYKWMYVM